MPIAKRDSYAVRISHTGTRATWSRSAAILEATVLSPSPSRGGEAAAVPATAHRSSFELSLQGRLLTVRRRRLALRVRDWLGIGVVACFSVTLFAVTFLSLVGR